MTWLPMNTAPRTGEPILVKRGDRRSIVRWAVEQQDGWSLDLQGEDYCAVIHGEPDGWMRLPSL